MSELVGVAEDMTIQIVHSGVDTTRFHPGNDGVRTRFNANVDQDAPVVALMARFQDVKGHHIFQEMARHVALQIPDVRFLVAGEDVHGVAADSLNTLHKWECPMTVSGHSWS